MLSRVSRAVPPALRRSPGLLASSSGPMNAHTPRGSTSPSFVLLHSRGAAHRPGRSGHRYVWTTAGEPEGEAEATSTPSPSSPTPPSSWTPASGVQHQKSEPAPLSGVALRPYQVDCVRAVLQELERGEFTRLGVSAPTGSGKTVIFTSLISRLPPLVHPATGAHATSVLVVVNKIQLVKQTAAAVKKAYPHLVVEIDQGSNFASGLADVTSLAYASCARLDRYDPARFKAIIIDEAHHAAAQSYLDILGRFDSHIGQPLDSSLEDLPRVRTSDIAPAPADRDSDHLIGADEGHDGVPSAAELPNPLADADPLRLSATSGFAFASASAPHLPQLAPMPFKLDAAGNVRVPLLAFTATWTRTDRLALGQVFEKIVWHADWLGMIRGRWLSDLKFTTVNFDEAVDLSRVGVSPKTGDFSPLGLAEVLDTDSAVDLAIKAWLDNASNRRSTLVFAANIAHVHSLCAKFHEHGIEVRSVSSKTKQAEREEIYCAFKAGEFPVLVNCEILTEGADFPSIDCVLLARPTRSQVLFLQMIGRGLRLSPSTGKRDCLVVELIPDATGVGLFCTPTLFGLDPSTVVREKSPGELETMAASQDPPRERLDPLSGRVVTYKRYRLFDLVREFDAHCLETFTPLARITPHAWVGCGDKWVLPLHKEGHLEIKRLGDEFRAWLHLRKSSRQRDRERGGPAPLPFAADRSFAQVLNAADTVVHMHPKLSDMRSSLKRDAPWRDEPASASQRAFVVEMLADLEKARYGPRDTAAAGDDDDGVPRRSGWKARIADPEFKRGEASDLLTRLCNGSAAWLQEHHDALVYGCEEMRDVKKEKRKRREKRRAAAEREEEEA